MVFDVSENYGNTANAETGSTSSSSIGGENKNKIKNKRKHMRRRQRRDDDITRVQTQLDEIMDTLAAEGITAGSGKLRCKLITNNARMPERATQSSAGFDLAASESAVIPAGGKVVVKTGLTMAVPDGTYGRIAPRSGLSTKHMINVGAGVIDSDYRGEVGVVLFNHGDKDIDVRPGDRVAQLVLEKVSMTDALQVDELEATSREDKGFGSTGMNQVNMRGSSEGSSFAAAAQTNRRSTISDDPHFDRLSRVLDRMEGIVRELRDDLCDHDDQGSYDDCEALGVVPLCGSGQFASPSVRQKHPQMPVAPFPSGEARLPRLDGTR